MQTKSRSCSRTSSTPTHTRSDLGHTVEVNYSFPQIVFCAWVKKNTLSSFFGIFDQNCVFYWSLFDQLLSLQSTSDAFCYFSIFF